MKAIELVNQAVDIGGVVVGLLASDLQAAATEYADAYISLDDGGVNANAVSRLARIANRFDDVGRMIGERHELKNYAAQAIGQRGFPSDASNVEWQGLIGGAGVRIGRAIVAAADHEYGNSESIAQALSGALALTVDAGLTGTIMERAQKEIRSVLETALKRARTQEKTNALTQAVASVKPEDGPAALTGLIDLVKQQTDGMTPDEVNAYMRAGALAEIDRAALRVGRVILNDIGPESLPDGVKAASGKVRSEQVIIGKLKAATPEDALREYSNGINAAMALLRDAVQAEYSMDARKAAQELSDAVDRGEIPADELVRRYEEVKQEIHQQAVERQKRMAREAVARQLGLDVEEMERSVSAVDDMARTLRDERGRYGDEILSQLRGMGLDREQAYRIQKSKVSMSPGARKLIGNTDDSVTDLMRLIGRGVTQAGAVEVLSISEVKKKHPMLYRGRSVTRAFCANGYRKTASGGEDIGVIGMGTRSRDVATLWHEMGHWLEHNNPMVRGIVKAWFEKRTAGEKPVRLKNLIPQANFGKDEITLKDNFIHPYMGKVYSSGSTEIVSMGLEYLSDPVTAAELASKDPDMFSLMVKIIEVINAG